jgi:hypothetical protein
MLAKGWAAVCRVQPHRSRIAAIRPTRGFIRFFNSLILMDQAFFCQEQKVHAKTQRAQSFRCILCVRRNFVSAVPLREQSKSL